MSDQHSDEAGRARYEAAMRRVHELTGQHKAGPPPPDQVSEPPPPPPPSRTPLSAPPPVVGADQPAQPEGPFENTPDLCRCERLAAGTCNNLYPDLLGVTGPCGCTCHGVAPARAVVMELAVCDTCGAQVDEQEGPTCASCLWQPPPAPVVCNNCGAQAGEQHAFTCTMYDPARQPDQCSECGFTGGLHNEGACSHWRADGPEPDADAPIPYTVTEDDPRTRPLDPAYEAYMAAAHAAYMRGDVMYVVTGSGTLQITRVGG